MNKLILVLLVLLLLIIGVILFFIFRRNKKGLNSSENNDDEPSQPSSFPDQSSRLRVSNLSNQDLWIQQLNLPFDNVVIKIKKGDFYDYNVPDSGAPSVRIWPKTNCDESGENCETGQSQTPCPNDGCQPPFETKVEFTFGDINDPNQNTAYDISFVDGFTLPVKVIVKGNDVGKNQCSSLDCSKLTLDECPTSDNLAGTLNSDLRVMKEGKIIGCLSPCQYSLQPPPYGLGGAIYNDPGLHMCCPTPCESLICEEGDPCNCAETNCRGCTPSSSCTWQNSCATSDSCSDSSDPKSIKNTDYYKTIKKLCKNAYGYSYDDNPKNENVLMSCSSKDKFEVIFM